mmetsp:Transcript_17150/g.55087  ORF Transcript_17150/g.55087 Transcript_17150/m.55087 type:complete len:458 (+) Transcript_17150:178-1551(+)
MRHLMHPSKVPVHGLLALRVGALVEPLPARGQQLAAGLQVLWVWHARPRLRSAAGARGSTRLGAALRAGEQQPLDAAVHDALAQQAHGEEAANEHNVPQHALLGQHGLVPHLRTPLLALPLRQRLPLLSVLVQLRLLVNVVPLELLLRLVQQQPVECTLLLPIHGCLRLGVERPKLLRLLLVRRLVVPLAVHPLLHAHDMLRQHGRPLRQHQAQLRVHLAKLGLAQRLVKHQLDDRLVLALRVHLAVGDLQAQLVERLVRHLVQNGPHLDHQQLLAIRRHARRRATPRVLRAVLQLGVQRNVRQRVPLLAAATAIPTTTPVPGAAATAAAAATSGPERATIPVTRSAAAAARSVPPTATARRTTATTRWAAAASPLAAAAPTATTSAAASLRVVLDLGRLEARHWLLQRLVRSQAEQEFDLIAERGRAWAASWHRPPGHRRASQPRGSGAGVANAGG